MEASVIITGYNGNIALFANDVRLKSGCEVEVGVSEREFFDRLTVELGSGNCCPDCAKLRKELDATIKSEQRLFDLVASAKVRASKKANETKRDLERWGAIIAEVRDNRASREDCLEHQLEKEKALSAMYLDVINLLSDRCEKK